MGVSNRMPWDGPIKSMVLSSFQPLYVGHCANVRVFHFEESGVSGSFNFAGTNGFEHIMLGLLRAGL